MTRPDRLQRSMASALAMATGNAGILAPRPLPLSSIRPGEAQPRTYFDEAALERLAADIRQHGILQPLLVRPAGAGYELVDGERRWRAAQRAGLTEAPALVRTLTLEQARLAALSTALNREGLTPIEHATAKLSLAALALGVDDLDAVKLELGRLSRPTADPARREQVDAVFATLDGENLKSFVKTSLPLLSYPTELQEAMRGGLEKTKARLIKNAPEDVRPRLLDMAIGGASRAELTEVIRAAQSHAQPSQAQQIGKLLLSTRVDKLKPDEAEALATWLASAPRFVASAEP
ncbi:ParB/RepB/Spo0J family partition protein [Deinococcus wulumuqiensis]|uniref:Chromosome 2-partitioning protein ParB n=1 Tax=Deinococcus wulumuqiensis TaxID=980427 RepID=A0AAV4K4Y1_9DEIO|nr:ParB/RepB/Spo0J family partition protein [Deinococcus wulumuqiensis]GGI75572.1 putative chromosome 2-partitioning protein ParB [Deinococcus wulumuqiensis]GGP28742.1 putative chromosome 2-partitioning protein ParB [Deinococcus wulumuqiensis]